MKKTIVTTLTAFVFIACGGNSNQNVDDLVKTNDIKLINARKTELQADLAKIETALAKLNVKVDEALVEVESVKDTVFNHYLEIQGNVETKENILIQPEMPGALIRLNVKAGQRVSIGQILGQVDDAGMGQQLAQIQTQYELAKTTFERQKRLWDQKIGSEIQYLQAQTQMVSLSKSINQMKAQLAKTQIRAPFTGVIDEVFVERGQIVSANPQGLMRIVNLNNMYVTTEVPETYIGKIKVGTNVKADITSINKIYNGKVRQVGNNINQTNRSFGIEVSIPNPENLLRPNQVAKLRIIDYSNPKAIVVPTNIIQEDATGNKFVFVADKVSSKTATAKKVMITTGKSSQNVTEILNGLSANDKVVTEGVNSISEGMKLNF